MLFVFLNLLINSKLVLLNVYCNLYFAENTNHYFILPVYKTPKKYKIILECNK